MNPQVQIKYNHLIHFLKRLNKVAIAFSGGVDSTFLLAAAKEALDKNIVAFTVDAPHIPDWEIKEAKDWIKQAGINHEIIKTEIPENIKDNPSNRCYLCKKKIFTLLKSEAAKQGIHHLLEGTNKDDEGDYRPGIKALKELDVLSPLRALGFTKKEIRQYSKKIHLPTWNKPAYACLLTRIPYNTTITHEELSRIEKGEIYLFQLGLTGARLRSHGNIARIEFQQEHLNVLNDEKLRGEIAVKIKSIGYQFVCVDIEGYRRGSFDQLEE